MAAMINIKTEKGFARYLLGKKIIGIEFGKEWGMPDKVIIHLENGGRLQFFAEEGDDQGDFAEMYNQARLHFWKAKEASND